MHMSYTCSLREIYLTPLSSTLTFFACSPYPLGFEDPLQDSQQQDGLAAGWM
jgi:hypothetical protein